MRAWMCVVIAACASGKAEQQPAPPAPAPAPAAKAESQVAMNAPAPSEPKAAGDPDEGGQAAPTTVAMADSAGPSGLGVRGAGPGGGGTGDGTIGIGSIGTIGKGAGGGTGTGAGYGGMRGRPDNQPRVAAGNPTLQGSGLAKEVVMRIVRRNLMRVRYCYEKSLMKNPSLAGLLMVKFTIRADGTVNGLEAHFGADHEVEQCTVAALQNVEFPKPTAGVVAVSYPFNLSPQ